MSAGLTVPTLSSIQEALALGLFTLCLLAARPAGGQEVTAAITGTVVDPTRSHCRRGRRRHRYRTGHRL